MGSPRISLACPEILPRSPWIGIVRPFTCQVHSLGNKVVLSPNHEQGQLMQEKLFGTILILAVWPFKFRGRLALRAVFVTKLSTPTPGFEAQET